MLSLSGAYTSMRCNRLFITASMLTQLIAWIGLGAAITRYVGLVKLITSFQECDHSVSCYINGTGQSWLSSFPALLFHLPELLSH